MCIRYAALLISRLKMRAKLPTPYTQGHAHYRHTLADVTMQLQNRILYVLCTRPPFPPSPLSTRQVILGCFKFASVLM